VRKYCHIIQRTDKISWRNLQRLSGRNGMVPWYGIFHSKFEREMTMNFVLERRWNQKKIFIASGFLFSKFLSIIQCLPFSLLFCAFSLVKWHKNFRNILKMRISIKINFIGEMLLHWKCDIHQGSLARFASLSFHWFPPSRFFYCACPFCARFRVGSRFLMTFFCYKDFHIHTNFNCVWIYCFWYFSETTFLDLLLQAYGIDP